MPKQSAGSLIYVDKPPVRFYPEHCIRKVLDCKLCKPERFLVTLTISNVPEVANYTFYISFFIFYRRLDSLHNILLVTLNVLFLYLLNLSRIHNTLVIR